MNRRNFIKNTSMAAALLAASPVFPTELAFSGTKKKLVFIFRGVGYADAFNAFKKFNINNNLNFHIQKAICVNNAYTHAEGINALLGTKTTGLIESQKLDRYSIPDILSDVFTSPLKGTQHIYLHHTEIAHSSNKLYLEKLELFFSELAKFYDPKYHRIVITADIGRNEKLNSCGGKDHSNSTCLETFALYLGGKASKLAANTAELYQNQVLKQKF